MVKIFGGSFDIIVVSCVIKVCEETFIVFSFDVELWIMY